MRIAHVQHYYEPEIMYQETALSSAHSKLGHEVLVITSSEKWPGRPFGTNTVYGEGIQKNNLHGVSVVRLKTVAHNSRHAMPFVRGVYRTLLQFQPDVVFLQGLTNASLVIPTIKFVKKLRVPLGIISHMNMHNSSYQRSRYSFFFHRFWKFYYMNHENLVSTFLPVEMSEFSFLEKVYNIQKEKMHILRLGGWTMDREHKEERSKYWRERLSIPFDNLVFIHISRVNPNKGVLDVMDAFSKLPDNDISLAVFGPIMTRNELEIKYRDNMIIRSERDPRIKVVDRFIPNHELIDMACIGDIGVYFGNESIAAREVLCLGIPLITKDTMNWHYVAEKGALFEVQTKEELRERLQSLSNNRVEVEQLKQLAFNYAKNELDWMVLAKKSLSYVNRRF